jgi:hypothetical protein
MPGVSAWTPLPSTPEEIEKPPEVGYFTEMSYISPQGMAEVKLDEGGEFRMGCEVWYRIRLLQDGRDRTRLHKGLVRYLKDNHPYSTTGLRPWNVAGDKIALPTVSVLGIGFMVYDITRARLAYSCRDRLWSGSAWSPTRDELFLMISDNWIVFGGSGDVQGRVIRHGPTSSGVCGWTPSGDSFFYLEQGEMHPVPKLCFFSRDTCEPIEEVRLDPSVLAPYEDQPDQNPALDTYSMPMTSGAVGVGRLLNEWSYSWGTGQQGQLLVAVVRPDPLARGRYSEKWISVEISD